MIDHLVVFLRNTVQMGESIEWVFHWEAQNKIFDKKCYAVERDDL